MKSPSPDIMVIDDTAANLHLLGKFLTRKGYQVSLFPSGRLALAALEERCPDLILLDVRMPGIDGHEVCRLIKADERLQHIPIIFISAMNDKEAKLEAFRLGGVDYILKPFQFEEVQARIETHLKIRQLNHALEQKVLALEELRVLKDNLVHMIVHDLRSPLQGITGYVELLQMELSVEETKHKRWFASIRRNAHTLQGMVTNLLDLNRLESGKMPLSLELVSTRELAMQATTDVEHLTEKLRLLVTDETDGSSVRCDRELIQRVLQNLIHNAIKYTPQQGTIELIFEQDEDFLRFSVEDEGPGVAPENQIRVFDKFFRIGADTGEHRRYSTGLGLAFCRLAVEAHGGEIGVESDGESGSVFWFTLPLLEAGPV